MNALNKLIFAITFALTAGMASAVHPSEVKYPTPNPPEPCKPKNILGIGNSFMYSLTVGENNLVRLAKKLGYGINHTALFKENCSMSMHWENRDKVGYYTKVSMAGGDATPRTQPAGVNESNASLESLLAYGTWDVIVLQSGVDKSWSSSEWRAYSNLVARVHETNPNAKIFLHQTWGMGRNFCKRDGLPSIDGRDDFYESVAKEYSRAYHEPPAGVTIDGILPIGYATELYYYREPSFTISQERFIIHPDDDKHLSHSGGEAMQAMVWCQILFGDVPSVANMPATFTSSCGDKLGLLRECALAACEPDVSYFDYGRGTVDFRFNVTFKNYDGTVLDTQSISNLTSAVAPDISLINVGEGYEPSGWKSSPSAKLMTSEEVNKAKVYNPITYTLNRKLVGEAGPTRVWTGYTSKSWNVAGNWDPAVVPDKDSDVYIPLGGAGANMLVQLDEVVTVNSLTIGTGEGEGTAELSLTGNNKILTVKGDLVIKNKGKLSSESNGYYSSQNRKMRSYTGGYKVDAVVGGNITIDEGGSVDVSGKGYVHGRGFKSAYTSSGTYDNGEINGSHAGNSSGAGTSTTATPSTTGKTYGSIRRPTTVGGGGHQYNFNGFGGGAIHLVCTNGTMTINGDILACGESYTSNDSYPQTGAGGSIWLEAGSFFGTGTIDVRGGAQPSGKKRYGCGASGRVALYTRETSFHAFNPSAIRVFAGPREAYTTGTANQNKNCHGGGTIYREHCNHTPGCGDLIIDGGDVATINEKFGTVISQYVDEGHDEDAIFNMISIQNQGRLIVNDGEKLRTRLLDIAEIGEKGSYSGTIEIVSEHNWGDWVTNSVPTCTTMGERVHACTDEDCDMVETNAIAALGHDWGEWTTNVVPTVEQPGERTHTCRREGCGATESETLPKLEPEPPVDPVDPPVDPVDPPDDPVVPIVDPTSEMEAEDGYELMVGLDRVLVFTNTAKTMTFTVPKGVESFEYLVVGGGGGGGRYARCGGGGAGGLVSNTVSCVKGATYTIKVGAGGQKAAKSTSSKVGEDGKDSSICIGSTTIAIGYGGGGGGSSGTGKINGRPGGSGGGSSGHAGGLSTAAAAREASTATQSTAPCGGLGNPGGAITSSKDDRGGSGGGGAGGAAPQVSGSKGGAGGIGVMSMITGEEKWYAAGGGGGGQSTGGAGGSGIGGAGGGSGSSGKNGSGSDGLPGTGSGGGGSGNTGSYQGGSGGHGVVIIRYTQPKCLGMLMILK